MTRTSADPEEQTPEMPRMAENINRPKGVDAGGVTNDENVNQPKGIDAKGVTNDGNTCQPRGADAGVTSDRKRPPTQRGGRRLPRKAGIEKKKALTRGNQLRAPGWQHMVG